MAERFAIRLTREIEHWVREGLLAPGQAERILARYPARAAWFSRPIVLFSLIGGALIAAGIALVVAHNWDAIHRWVKLGGLVALMGAAHLGGLALRERGYPRVGDGLLVIGGGLLLVGIALVGQIYNLSGRPSDPILLWWALLLPAAYALPSLPLGSLAYLGLAVWYLMAILDPATPLGAGLGGNDVFKLLAISAFGMPVFSLGVLHGDGEYRQLRQLLEQIGLFTLLAGLLPFGVAWRTGHHIQGSGEMSLSLWGLMALGLLAIAIAAYRLPQDSRAAWLGFLAVLLVTFLYLVAVQVAIWLRAPREVFRTLTYLDWLLLFGVCLAFILCGARWDRTSWINWGVVFLGLHAVGRYVDLVGTMLQTSALFISAGAFVLLLGWGLERIRRRMTAHAAARRGSA
jgi:uncharacterized membrane protein